MSHFTVLVIGDDVDGQLAPFHEFECTGSNDQYVVDEDVTEEIQARIDDKEDPESIEEALGHYGLEDKIVDDESKVEKVGDECPHKYGYAIVKDGVLIKAVDRTNPNRKWDWYVVGGRWSGFLKLKEGAVGTNGDRPWMDRGKPAQAGVCDSARKGAIDFDGMRQEAADRAGEAWDKAHELFADRAFRTWEEVRESCKNAEGQTDWDKAREVYNSQPPVIDFSRHFGPFTAPSKFLVSREQFMNDAHTTAVNTFAVLKGGEWFEKGEMGWWGMSTDNMTDIEWAAKVGEMIASLSDDTLLTVVDCHI